MWQWIVIILFLSSYQVFAGEDYITYTDPKTGVKYFGDSIPQNAPKDLKIEKKRH